MNLITVLKDKEFEIQKLKDTFNKELKKLNEELEEIQIKENYLMNGGDQEVLEIGKYVTIKGFTYLWNEINLAKYFRGLKNQIIDNFSELRDQDLKLICDRCNIYDGYSYTKLVPKYSYSNFASISFEKDTPDEIFNLLLKKLNKIDFNKKLVNIHEETFKLSPGFNAHYKDFVVERTFTEEVKDLISGLPIPQKIEIKDNLVYIFKDGSYILHFKNIAGLITWEEKRDINENLFR